MSEIKIFEMSDYEWWAGETAESCIEDYIRETGVGRDEVYAEELGDDAMDRFVFTDDDGTKRTFREQLNRMIEAGDTFPCLFASTEF